MTTKNTWANRLLSILLCIALLVSYLPAYTFQASAADAPSLVADSSTMDGWRNYFLPADGSLSTENAGGVWTDKSVFTNGDAFLGTGITQDSTNSFLVALSAIASNKTITGMSSVPTDTVLVLDMSSSMDRSGSVPDLAQAANDAIKQLLALNAENRVGVVFYSGHDNTQVFMPLDHYTAGQDGNYLVSQNVNNRSGIAIASGVENSAGQSVSGRDSWHSGTFTQGGIYEAMQMLLNADAAISGNNQRMPVIILMSDGEPSVFASDYSGNDGQSTSLTATRTDTTTYTGTGTEFLVQLTAAYAKYKIDLAYELHDLLFYSLGFAVTDGGVVADYFDTTVLDPASNTDTDSYWESYLKNENLTLAINNYYRGYSLSNDGNVLPAFKAALQDAANNRSNRQNKYRYYADYYYQADSQGALSDAFNAIVSEIQLQTKFFPTLISADEELSGYVSFVDRIGQYMKVTDVKGLLIHDTLFSGADLASNFVDGGGLLGTTDNPTALGDELVWAVMARLGLATSDEARTLIGLAYQYGQLSYTSATEFSNYIGWYANADGEFLGFWHEGITTMPDPNDPTLTAEKRPAYIMKSYGYLGEVDEAHGVEKSDMMYAVVQVREDILTGEQMISFGIPAALIPTITYNVSLDENGDLTSLTATGATSPIRLVYEVALDPAINAYSLKELVSADYLAKHTDPATGAVSFYSNQYEVDGSLGNGKLNTYSYFNPSRQNERFYYQRNATVYIDQNGTPYTGTEHPAGTMYRSYTVYEKNAEGMTARTVYRRLSENALNSAIYDADAGNWYIPQGNVHVNMDGYISYKGGQGSYDEALNLTGTLIYSAYPYVDIENHAVDNTGHSFLVGTFLGNNGKLSIVPATGIKLTKTLAADAAVPTEPFTFELVNTTNAADNNEYSAQLVAVDGTTSETTVKFTDGKATVQLMPGESIYISGMSVGQTIRITEQETVEYVVQTVNGFAVDYAELTIEPAVLAEANFVNANRGKGDLTISKEVEHDFGTEYQIPADKSFTITVTLSGVGTANATFQAKQTNSDITTITTDADGKFTVTLKDNEQLQVLDLPAGTQVSVVELDPGTGFEPVYWVNGASAQAGQVTVEADRIVSVIVVNDYTPGEVYPVNITVDGTKLLTGREWLPTDVFEFQLQKLTGPDTWDVMATTQVKGTDTEKNFDFNGAFANEKYTTAGVYYYRVVEVVPTEALGGVTYDRTVHAFVVVVGDADMDGKLEITEVRAERPATTTVTQPTADSWNVEVNFTNTYSTTGSATVTIDLNKAVNNPTGSSLALPSGFRFGLYEAGKTEPTFVSEPTTDRGFARLVLSYTVPGTYKYTLKEIAPDPVPAGWTYSTEEVQVTVVVLDDGDGTMSAVIYQGTASAGATISLSTTFTNTYDLTPAELPIDFVSKQLSGRTMAAGEFTFAVLDQSGATVLTGTNDASGKVTFNDTLKFTQVGVYFFDIVETTVNGNGITVDKNVYRVTVTVKDNGAGALEASYVLVNAEGDFVVFRNSYTASPVTNTLSGIKFLEGRTLINDEFTFRLTEALDAEGNVAENAAFVDTRNTVDGRFSFPAQTYTAAGTYYYLISEVQPTADTFGVSYDKTEFVVTVTVIDNGLGNLVVQSVTYAIKGNGAATGIIFVNKYSPNPTVAQIPGTKLLTGKVLGAGTFSFELYESNANWEQGTKLETVQNNADGSFTFKPFTIKTAGSYYYLVKEVNGGQTIDGITYDSTVYRVRIDATDNLRGQLNIAIYYFDSNNIPQNGVEFVNVYKIVGNDQITLNGDKTLVGRELKDGEFTFELYQADAGFHIQGAAIQTATNASGSFSFTLHYTPEDVGNTYHYVVKEANAGKTINGVTYTSAEYHITVVVQDDGVGGIKTTTTILDGTEAVQIMHFTNTYTAAPTSVGFDGTKVLENKQLAEGDFRFDLYETSNTFVPHSAALQSVTNKLDGSFSFADVALTEAKTYYFLIKENSQNPAGGISYDHSEYHITVVVKDDGLGNLYVDSKTISHVVNGVAQSAAEIRFVNSYSAKSTSITLGGSKVLTGRDLLAGEFTFLLQETNASFVPLGTPALLAVNDADGSFLFDALTFTSAGTYYYIITEDSTDPLERVTYDASVYRVTIQVTDDGQGQLVVGTPTITKAGAAATQVTFENTYTPRPEDITVDIAVDKTVVNLGTEKIGPEGFEFVLENTVTGEKQTVHSDTLGDALYTLKFTEDDIGKTFTYKLYEVNNGRANVTYSTLVYNITITISLNSSNELVATKTVNGATVQNILASFENTYDFTPKDISVYVAVDKTVVNKGSESIGPEGFEFILENVQTGEKKSVKTNAEGVVLYDLVFTAYDIGKTFEYKLYEVDGGMAHVTYDPTVYTISITISQDASGELVATVKLNNQVVGLVDAQFTNIYDFTPEDISVYVAVDKTVNNVGSEKIGPEGFEFVLENLQTGEKTAVKTNAEGIVLYELVFTAADKGKTFEYKLYELNDGRANVTYDATVYHIVITISLNAEGKLEAEVKLNGTVTSVVNAKFVNTYDFTPDDLPVEFAVNKSVVNTGSEEIGADGFQFVLENTATGEKQYVTSDASGKASFLLNYTAADVGKTFTYTLAEVDQGKANVTYSKVVYNITVTISLNAEGKLEAALTLDGVSKDKIEVSFENTYNFTPDDLIVEFGVNKTVKNIGSQKIGADGFQFVLENTATGEKQTVISDGSGNAKFQLNFTAQDKGKTFNYKLYEINDGKSYVTYSEVIYEISVTISLNAEGKLEAALTLDGVAKDKIEVSFENTYDFTPDDVSVQLAVDKTVTNKGTEKIGPSGFEFVLENVETGEKKAVKTNAEGVVLYDLVFTAADIGKTFTYKLYEVNDGRAHVSYDDTIYTITITISLNANGKLEAAMTLDGQSVEQVNAAFENTYDFTPDDLTVQVAVDKTVTNLGSESIGPDGFEFILENVQTGEKKAVKTNAEGVVLYDLVFTAADKGKTFTYKLYEVSDGRAHVTYDDTVYTITITIGLNAQGKLEAVVTLDGEEVSLVNAKFVNTYDFTPDDLAVEFAVDKTVTNKGSETMSPEGFRFVLENTATGEKKIVQTDASGKAAFRLIYQAADKGKTFTYKLYEMNDGQSYVTYSSVIYEIKVVVTLNAEGKLEAALTLDGMERENIHVAFENVYDFTPGDISVDFAVDKTVTNKGTETMTPEGFEFVLEDTVTGQKQSLKTDALGQAIFKLNYSAEDKGKTFTYKLYEVNDGRANVTYSTLVYEITVTIRLNAEGKLEADLTINGEAKDSVRVAFENTYDFTPDPDDLPVEFEVIKTIVNKGSESIGPEGFKFQLENVETGEKWTVKSDALGKGLFQLIFTSEDAGKTFTYKVTEINDGRAFITYSEAEYTITVTITKNAENMLEATVTMDGQATEKAVAAFENVFDYTELPPGPPDTSDSTLIGMWVALLFISGGCLAIMTRKRIRK